MLSKPDAAEADLGLGTVIEAARDGPALGHIGHRTRVLRHKPPITHKPVLRYAQGLSPNIHPSGDENLFFVLSCLSTSLLPRVACECQVLACGPTARPDKTFGLPNPELTCER